MPPRVHYLIHRGGGKTERLCGDTTGSSSMELADVTCPNCLDVLAGNDVDDAALENFIEQEMGDADDDA